MDELLFQFAKAVRALAPYRIEAWNHALPGIVSRPGKGITNPCISDVGNNRPPVAIAYTRGIAVSHRQRKACARQKVSGAAQVDLRMDMRSCDVALCSHHQRFERRQRANSEHMAQEQAVGFQGAPDLNQSAGKVVDAIQRSRGDDKVEAVRRKGQAVLFGYNCIVVFCGTQACT